MYLFVAFFLHNEERTSKKSGNFES